MRRSIFSQICLTVVMLGLGIAIVVQFRARGHVRVVSSDRDEQLLLISELVDANQSLRAEIESLEAQEQSYEGNDKAVGLEELVAELNRLKVLNGAIEVSGPGVELLVDGPLTVLDLLDLINELRNAGAEAIALNGRRLVTSSALVAEAKGQITVNGQPLTRPYRFEAIGDPGTLETALLRPGGLLSLFRRTYPNLIVQTTQRSKLVLGVNRAHTAFQFAEPIE